MNRARFADIADIAKMPLSRRSAPTLRESVAVKMPPNRIPYVAGVAGFMIGASFALQYLRDAPLAPTIGLMVAVWFGVFALALFVPAGKRKE